MLNELAISHPTTTSADEKSIALPRVALRFLPRQPKDFQALFGIADLPLARRYLREQLYHRGIRDEVLDALDIAPRHVFVPTRSSLAYVDISLHAEHSFVHSPGVVATTVSTLSSPDAQVLEIGTGTGYQSAVLAAFGAHVTTIDSNEAKQLAARERFGKLDLNIQTLIRVADPIEGLEHKTYDLIVVNEALRRLPRRLLGVLRPGGGIVAPVILADGTTRLMRYRHAQDEISAVDLGPCFAPTQRKEGAA
jgi:protein-L-isoaspartate(D-aspartate) O-methyltransferase